jgi:hypothetical protein
MVVSARTRYHRRHIHGDVPRSLWTEGQFPVFIFDAEHLRNAIDYVRRHNTQAGRPADPYDWIAVDVLTNSRIHELTS